jgi:hypothetical protein
VAALMPPATPPTMTIFRTALLASFCIPPRVS